ncbi:MAG TPA: hypothetical protein VEM41_00765, partial [Actinomycetota bacterium]|nr:hypothetical protein [Actinomycetota bacterium]
DGRKGNLRGRTRTNKLVHLAGSDVPGTFLQARVREAHPHHLTAESARGTDGPRTEAPGGPAEDSAPVPLATAAPG